MFSSFLELTSENVGISVSHLCIAQLCSVFVFGWRYSASKYINTVPLLSNCSFDVRDSSIIGAGSDNFELF